MSRVRFALYFSALIVCATAAFASTAVGKAAASDALEYAAVLPLRTPHSAALPKRNPHAAAPKETRIALLNSD